MEFVWNEVQAEDIRAQTAAAMQGQVEDMQAQAEQFMKEADALQAEAEALRATLPIMKAIQVRNTRQNSEGKEEAYYTSKIVEDTAATLAREAEIEALEDRIKDLHTAADMLNEAANILSQEIDRTNALFQRMFEYSRRTDARYAARIREIQDRINAYTHRMTQIRDSFIASFMSEAEQLASFGGAHSASLNLVNPSTVTGRWEPPNGLFMLPTGSISVGGSSPFGLGPFPFTIPPDVWDDIAEFLSRPANNIRMTEYSALAFTFGRMHRIDDKERFLHLLADPIDLPGLSSTLHLRGFSQAYTVCPLKVAGIQLFLELDIAMTLAEQTHLRSENRPYRHMDAVRYNKMQNSAVLSAVASLMPPPATGQVSNEHLMMHHLFLANDNSSPFTLSPWDIDGGWLTLSTSTTPFTTGGTPLRTFNPVNEEIHISRVLSGGEVGPKLRSVVGDEVTTRHLYNPARDFTSGVSDLAFGAASAAAPPIISESITLIDMGRTVWGTVAAFNRGMEQAAAIQNEFSLILGYWSLSDFTMGLNIESVIIWQPGEDPFITNRASLSSQDSLNMLNSFIAGNNTGNQITNNSFITWEDFVYNPVAAAYEAFNRLSIAQQTTLREYQP